MTSDAARAAMLATTATTATAATDATADTDGDAPVAPGGTDISGPVADARRIRASVALPGPEAAPSVPSRPADRSRSRRASVTIDGTPFPVRPHHCFACGSLNVEGIGLPLHIEGDSCWTELELPDRFEGWEGIAHGGIVCTILDEVMAWSLAHRDAWGFTARMTVEFKRPVPIATPIRGEGRLVEQRRRLMTTAGRLVDARTGEVLATAEAVYVTAPADRKADLKRRYGFDEAEW